MGFYVVLNIFLEFIGGFGAFCEHDTGFYNLSANFIRCGADTAFKNIGEFHDYVFNLERSYAVAGGFDKVIGSADVPEESVLILPGKVAGVIESVLPGFGGLFRAVVILITQAAGKTFADVDADFTGVAGSTSFPSESRR